MDHKDYRLAAIVFTDIVGFSRMMEQDESGTIQLLEYHNQLIRSRTDEFKGSIIKTIGDAFLVDFTNTVNAVRFAVAVQGDLEQYNQEHPEKKLILRIGIHLGDIYFYENDALGEGINIASRLQSLCNPGRICISQDVYNLSRGKFDGPEVRELGDVKLKNITREIRAYEILTAGTGDPVPHHEYAPKASDQGDSNARPSKPSQADKSSAATPQGPATNPDGTVDEAKLKELVILEIKRAGQRLTPSQVRGWFGNGPLPEGLDAAVTMLSRKGFLAPESQNPRPQGRRGSGSGYEYSSGSPGGSGGRPSSPGQGRAQDGEFEEGIRELKRAAKLVGREIQNAWRDRDSWFADDPRGRRHRIPRHRADGENDRRDKEVERQWDRVLETTGDPQDEEQYIIQEYRKQTDISLKKSETGLKGHLASYIGVNGLLTFIWATTTAPGFPWFLIPAAAWGIGMLSHIGSIRRRRRENAELKALPGLNKFQLRLLRKLHKNRERWGGHFLGSLGASLFLAMLNLITSPMVPWSVFPIAGMAIGIFTHLPGFKSKEHQLLADLRDQGVPVQMLMDRKDRKKLLGMARDIPENATPQEAEAERMRAVILAQLGSFKGKNPLGDDFEDLLNDYVDQIHSLSQKDREIDSLLGDLSVQSLDRDKAELIKQRDQTDHKALRAEYEKSITQIEKQQKAFNDLEAERRMVKLKLSGAMNSLRQVQLELVRLKGTGSQELPDLRERSGQLSSYLSDMRSGYSELENSDFAELEKYRDELKNEGSDLG
ncbi:adenylate/guanylate cyclase domain-containing protein [Spirochaeta lutea]|uniref:adenylate/guanylate cyclase domain-containing protein n=1 Tax=Spirochaeta lutea TaxID=1480694 RepID=UPI00068B31ED|nr:adenylate/guanylate cyclase domain-containing protein [Spirochaeta lutea]